jgi:hypothetical protein
MMSAAVISAVTSEAESFVVARVVVPQYTNESVPKPEPCTVSVNAAPPATALPKAPN